MDKAKLVETYKFGHPSTSDIIVWLRTKDRREDWFYCHSHILKEKSKFFADQISDGRPSCQVLGSRNCVEVCCSESEYRYHAKLLELLYLSKDSVSESLHSVNIALGILQVAIALSCEGIIESCVQYLEAVPWEEKEEEEILKLVPSLGDLAMPILSRFQPVNPDAAKNVFLSAIRVATSNDDPCPPFLDLKSSAQEQAEYMLVVDEDAPLVVADDDVKSEVKTCLSRLVSSFKVSLSLLLSESENSPGVEEKRVLDRLSDLGWICCLLPKMDLMKDFVDSWLEISSDVLAMIQDARLDSSMWGVKLKVVEVAGKSLEAVGYGNVILPAVARVELLKNWLPFIRKMKPLLDSQSSDEKVFPYKMEEDLCQSIEGAITSLVLALPSGDQAEILADWMKSEQVSYPDLSEAFEVWCYRSKAAKRRLAVNLNGVSSNATLTH